MSACRRESSRSRRSEEEGDERTIFVGKLPINVQYRDVEDLFSSIGRISYIKLLSAPRNNIPFAFVTFFDKTNVHEAIRERDGFIFHGRKLRVERCHAALKSEKHRREAARHRTPSPRRFSDHGRHHRRDSPYHRQTSKSVSRSRYSPIPSRHRSRSPSRHSQHGHRDRRWSASATTTQWSRRR